MVENKKTKKPIFKSWKFWAILIMFFIVIGMLGDSENTSEQTIDEFTVTFDKANYEEKIVVNVNNGELVERINDPVKEPKSEFTYEFSHWATHEKTADGSEVYDFNTPITKSITLYAHYQSTYTPVENKKTKENFDTIKNGMSKEQVIQILGEPNTTSEMQIGNYETSEYFYYRVSSSVNCDIHFSNDKVTSKYWNSH